MNKKLYILISIISIIFVACAVQQAKKVFIGDWLEKEYDFTESIFHQESNELADLIAGYKWCCNNYNEKSFKWLRNDENLWITYNILKKIGLERFISIDDYNKKLFGDMYESVDWKDASLNDIVNNMIDSYDLQSDSNDYYQKFWQRRRNESNENIVIKILKDVDSYYSTSDYLTVDEDAINQNLYKLIKYNVELNESESLEKNNIAIEYFKYLRSIGLHHSAYNLVYELEITKDLRINRDSLIRTLKYDTIPEGRYWDTRNNAKWINTYLDDGP